MKKIFISLAAIAALTSCVAEKGLDPQQDAAGRVTIKAVSADTKTLLADDGTSVVWESTDQIKVVLKGTSGHVMTDFAVNGTPNGSTAEFTGDFDASELTLDEKENPYAVYPATTVTEEEGTGKVLVTHSLPAEQTGDIQSGMNLSSAILSLEELEAGNATAEFNSALALLKVVVPDGIKSVSLSASNYDLAGTASFTVASWTTVGGWDEDLGDYATVPATGKLTTSGGDEETVTLANSGEELAEGAHYLLVYPGNAESLTLTMTGTSDDVKYTKTLSYVELNAGDYYTLDLTQIFKMEYKATETVSPLGGELVVPVVTTEEYTYTVTIEDGNDWIEYVETRALNSDEIVFTIEANTTGAAREADVTIKAGEDHTRTFIVSQQSAVLDFVYVDPSADEPVLIQWEENFGVYQSQTDATAGTNAKATYKNTFTIALSDDLSKGTYKIENMFVYNDRYSGKMGGTYYADYEKGVLTVYKGSENTYSYAFSNSEIELTYNSVDKTFSAAGPIQFGYHYKNADLMNGGYLGGYSVKVYEPEPENPGDGSPLAAYVGTWTESFGYYQGWGDPSSQSGTFEVTIEGDKLLFTGMFNVQSYSGTNKSNYYGELSADGNSIELSDVSASTPHMTYGPIQDSNNNPSSITVTIDDGNLVITSAFNGMLVNYTATKQ